jgi:hypothetical protein
MNEMEWGEKLLERMGWPLTHENMVKVVAWELAEGGWFHNNATYNPLNTTQWEVGCKPINSVGVKAYPTLECGYLATIQTLNYGQYQHVRDSFLGNWSPQAFVAALASSPWGTGDGAGRTLGTAEEMVTREWSDMPQALDITGRLDCPTGGYWEQSYEGGIYAYDGAPDHDAYNRHPELMNVHRGFYQLLPFTSPSGVAGYRQVGTMAGEPGYAWPES